MSNMSTTSSCISLINGNHNNNSNNKGGNNGTSSGGSQACAACKYQRRKCTPGCSLAPYFPPEQQRQFLNAHKLFGVSNILKIIRNLDPAQKDEAMRTMIIQADIRASDPVGGCYRIIQELQCQIERDKAELQLVLHQLAICRAQAQAHLQLLQQQEAAAALIPTPQGPQPINHHLDPLSTASYITPMLHQQPNQQQQELQQGYLVEDDNNHHDQNHQGINQWVMQQDPNSNPNPNPSPNMMNHDLEASSSSMHVNKEPFMNECEDIKPFLGMFDDRQQPLPFDHKDSIQCSDKAVLNDEEAADSVVLKREHDSMKHVPENDLKGAASLFSLTNCNS